MKVPEQQPAILWWPGWARNQGRQRRGLLGCRVCLKARCHQAIIRVRG